MTSDMGRRRQTLTSELRLRWRLWGHLSSPGLQVSEKTWELIPGCLISNWCLTSEVMMRRGEVMRRSEDQLWARPPERGQSRGGGQRGQPLSPEAGEREHRPRGEVGHRADTWRRPPGSWRRPGTLNMMHHHHMSHSSLTCTELVSDITVSPSLVSSSSSSS